MGYTNKKRKITGPPGEAVIGSVRRPWTGEVLGKVIEFLGGDRLRADCEDDKERICRIRGKIRKRKWIRVGNIVLIVPWVVQGDTHGDVKWVYKRNQAEWLKQHGFLKRLSPRW